MPLALLTQVTDTTVFPDFGAVNGATGLAEGIGALLTIVLVVAVSMIVICAVTWAVATAHGNYHAAVKARTGVWVALGAAALAGAGVTWANFLIDLGQGL